MKLIIRDLLEYFDIKEATEYGDATATISIVGEDLGAGLFKHYIENQNANSVNVYSPNDAIPTEGKRTGKHLDRWILVENGNERTLYQTEIKSWCSRAIGGMTIPVEIANEDLATKMQRNWNSHIKLLNDSNINGLNKVLLEMPTDKKLKIEGKYNKEPLIIFWDARSPNKIQDFFNLYNVESLKLHFDHCYTFSCSLYLRYLYHNGARDIEIEMPNAERRLKDLSRIFKIQ